MCEKPVVSISKNIVCSLQRELLIKLSAVLLVLLSLLCISFRLNVLVINEKVDFILQDLGYYDSNNKYLLTPPTYIVGANEEIRAYLRGVFLCQGSINDPKTSQYHMELLIDKPQEAVFIQKLLNIFDLNAKII